jgi:hypothetical protein
MEMSVISFNVFVETIYGEVIHVLSFFVETIYQQFINFLCYFRGYYISTDYSCPALF